MNYQTINPFTEELVKEFPEHTDEQLERILAQADKIYRLDWRLRTIADRKKVLKKAAAILRRNRDEFARYITFEMGKLFSEATGEVDLSADILEYYADNAEAFLAPRKLTVAGDEAVVENDSLGVVLCIEPWNFPYYQLARVAGPNLMVGNTLIVKHAPNVPQCALAFEKLLLDAGAPVGVYSNVFISNEQAGRAIADHRVTGVALTGSERAGSAVASEAGAALKKSTIELGGSDAYIVLEDADLDKAVKWAVFGRMNNAGQTCCGAKRFILRDEIADEFLNRFKSELSKFEPGDPMDPKTTLAPLCTRGALELADRQIDSAINGGATVLSGGKRYDRTGYFLQPTILTNLSQNNPAFYQEFFAPVALIFRVSSDEEAIKLANDSPYGLGGSILTENVERGKRLARQIDTGMVFINEVTWTAPDLALVGSRILVMDANSLSWESGSSSTKNWSAWPNLRHRTKTNRPVSVFAPSSSRVVHVGRGRTSN